MSHPEGKHSLIRLPAARVLEMCDKMIKGIETDRAAQKETLITNRIFKGRGWFARRFNKTPITREEARIWFETRAKACDTFHDMATDPWLSADRLYITQYSLSKKTRAAAVAARDFGDGFLYLTLEEFNLLDL